MGSILAIKEYNKNLYKTIIIIALTLIANAVCAQEPTQARNPVQVGIYVSEPFVNKEGSTYSGMAIDIWQNVAKCMNIDSHYVEYPNYAELMQAVSEGKVDAAVTNLTITESRAEIADFTYPWFDAGLRIMVHTQAGTGWDDLIDRLNRAGHMTTYVWVLVILVAATVLLTVFDRRFDKSFPKSWREGLAESFYQIALIATSGQSSRENLFGWLGRIWQTLWMVFGIAIVAYVTSSITSVMTIAHIENTISNLGDLQRKTVGVRTGSVAEQFLKSRSIATVSFDHLPTAVTALINDDIAAIVADGPVLEYYMHQHTDEPLDLAGDAFSPDKYGFAFPRHSEFVQPASLAIMGLHESDEIAKLKVKYFGPPD